MGLGEAREYYTAVQTTGSDTERAAWKGQMETANRKRKAGDIPAMDIYLPNIEKGTTTPLDVRQILTAVII